MNIRGILSHFPKIFGVPPDRHQATAPPAPTRYVPEADLPGDVSQLIAAGAIRAWRVAPDGQQWYIQERDAAA